MKLILNKGRGYSVGTVREWKGKKYKKTTQGWVPMPKQEKVTPQATPVQLSAQLLASFPPTPGNVNAAGVPYQPTGDIDQLYSMVEDTKDEFKEFTNALAIVTGAVDIHMRSKLKSRERVEVKVADYDGDYSRILDLNGGTLVFQSEAGIENLRKAISRLQPPVVRVKDRFLNPCRGGYRDYMANVTMPNGAIVEILATTDGIMREKSSGIGHEIYELLRVLPADDELTGVTDSLVRLSEKAYGAAAANDSARSREILTEWRSILPRLAGSIGSKLPDEVKRKSWFPSLTNGTSSQSKYSRKSGIALSDIATSIDSIGQTRKSLNDRKRRSKMGTQLYKAIVKSASEIKEEELEKGRSFPMGTIREWNGKKYKKTAKGWVPVSGDDFKEDDPRYGGKGSGPKKKQRDPKKTYGDTFDIPKSMPDKPMLVLMKAKYTKKWRGSDGKWRYQYKPFYSNERAVSEEVLSKLSASDAQKYQSLMEEGHAIVEQQRRQDISPEKREELRVKMQSVIGSLKGLLKPSSKDSPKPKRRQDADDYRDADDFDDADDYRDADDFDD